MIMNMNCNLIKMTLGCIANGWKYTVELSGINLKMDKYLAKIKTAFNGVDYEYNNLKDLLSIDIDDINKFLYHYYTNKDDFYYELFEFELRLRALRDKLDNG